jgi:Flp pilus assembly protein TadG
MNRSSVLLVSRALLRLARLLVRFRRDNRAVAVVEFALILPFLLLLYLGSIEGSALYTVDRRVTVISSTVADLVARWNPATTPAFAKADLRDYFKASLGIITPYSTTGLKQVVSLVTISAAGVAKVTWSCGYNGGVARVANTNYPLAATKQMNIIARGTAGGTLIAAEVSYAYTPMLGLVFTDAIELKSENLYLPRFATPIPSPVGGCPT